MKFVIILLGLVIGVLGYAIDMNGDWKLIGGQTAQANQFPFIISLRFDNRHICAGSIINTQWIVTAGNCVKGYTPEQLSVLAGSNQLLEGGEIYNVAKFIAYPSTSNRLFERNDIALIKVIGYIEFSKSVLPIGLQTEEVTAEEAVLAGWGKTHVGGPIPNNLQFLNIKTITNAECKKNVTVSNTEICTLTRDGKGTCNGDSGSSLVFNGKLTGVLSRRVPCDIEYPDIYTRVSLFFGWIVETMDAN